jgi:PAS domain S-box-containing protein
MKTTLDASLYSAIVALSGDVTFVTTRAAQIKFVSANVKEMLGYEAGELTETNLQHLTHTDDLEQLQAAIEKTLTPQGSATVEVRIKHCSGEWLWLEIIAVNQTHNDAVSGIIINARDITAKRAAREHTKNMAARMEAQLAYRNKELDTFIYRASHDLRGPVTTLMGLTEIAMLDTMDEEAKEYFANCRELAYRMEKTIYDLLSVTQVRQSTINIMNVQPQEIIYRTMQSKKHAGMIQDTTFDIQVNDAVTYKTDAALLGIIITQLTDNAIIFRKKDTQHTVSIKMEAGDSMIKIHVMDNGTGISAAEQDLIFDLYYRGKNDHTGSGIGLYIVKAATDKLGGSIRVQSEPGNGTEMIVYIPNCPD